MKPSSHSSLYGMWLLLLLVNPLPAAEYVELLAEIESLGYRLDDPEAATKSEPKKHSVRCIAGEKLWRIDFSGGEVAWMFDGTNVYRRQLSKSAKWPPFIFVSESNDGLPLGSFLVNLPWLAFCSGQYLKREGRLIPLPGDLLRHTRDRFAYRDVTTTFNDDLGLPRTIDLFSSKSLMTQSQNDFDEEHFMGDRYTRWKTSMVADIQEGILTFHYTVTESTNLFGRTFPLRFEFFQIGRPQQQNGNWFLQGAGRVTSLGDSKPPQGLLLPDQSYQVVDYRLRDRDAEVGSVRYDWANPFVLPPDHPELQKKLQAEVVRLGDYSTKRPEPAKPAQQLEEEQD